MTWGFIKYSVCIVLNVIKWINSHVGGFLVGFVGVVGLRGGRVSGQWVSGKWVSQTFRKYMVYMV